MLDLTAEDLPAPTDVVLTNSVVSFDGRVLELFGHASRTGNRIHVALITGIEEAPREITIKTRGQVEYSIVFNDEGEDVRAAVASLIASVRAAAPALDA
jgi:hypothetical protein